MRYLLIVFSFFICFFASASDFEFDSELHDFGTIREVDGKVSHIFKFKNIGTKPLVIEKISTSCGCTTPEYSKEPVMPNQTRDFKVTFDPEGRSGEFLKDVFISSNNAQSQNKLQIKGNIVPRPRTAKDDYPLELSGGLRLSTINLAFRYVTPLKANSMVVKVRNFSKKTATISLKSDADYLLVSKPIELKPSEIADLTLTYLLPEGFDYGTLQNHVAIYVNEQKQNFFLSCSAICVDDFVSLGDEVGEGEFSSQFLSLGSMSLGDSAEREVSLTNTGAGNLIVRKIQLPAGVTTTLSEGEVIKPNQSIKVVFSFKANKVERFKESVVVILNDPKRPMREIRLFATVLE